jgi:hypothetical protein
LGIFSKKHRKISWNPWQVTPCTTICLMLRTDTMRISWLIRWGTWCISILGLCSKMLQAA